MTFSRWIKLNMLINFWTILIQHFKKSYWANKMPRTIKKNWGWGADIKLKMRSVLKGFKCNAGCWHMNNHSKTRRRSCPEGDTRKTNWGGYNFWWHASGYNVPRKNRTWEFNTTGSWFIHWVRLTPIISLASQLMWPCILYRLIFGKHFGGVLLYYIKA